MALVDQQHQGGLLAAMWRPLRLETLVTLRWLALGGQTMVVLFVQFGLQYPLPLEWCLGVIGISALERLAHSGVSCCRRSLAASRATANSP